MKDIDLFNDKYIQNTFSTILKNSERRWGLTLISFLPSEAQNKFMEIKKKISPLIQKLKGEQKHCFRKYINFYYPQQFHITHLTLLRSDPCGPVHFTKLTQDKKRLFDLAKTIQETTSKINPIKVQFDKMEIGYSGIELIMIGECVGKKSINYRSILLRELNQSLQKRFTLDKREWDSDPSKYGKLHSMVGYIKREPPQGYKTFINQIKELDISPITFSLEEVTLVHHRYRTLIPPQEGKIEFPLGKKRDITESDLIRKLSIIV